MVIYDLCLFFHISLYFIKVNRFAKRKKADSSRISNRISFVSPYIILTNITRFRIPKVQASD